MLEIVVVMIVFVAFVVAAALFILYRLAVAQRPLEGWREHLRTQAVEWVAIEQEGVRLDGVEPKTVGLSELLDEESQPGSGYVSAEEVPGHELVESVATKVL